MKGIRGKNYMEAYYLVEDLNRTKEQLFKYDPGTPEKRSEINGIICELIRASVRLEVYSTSYAAKLDKYERILGKLKKIPILGYFIKRMEEA